MKDNRPQTAKPPNPPKRCQTTSWVVVGLMLGWGWPGWAVASQPNVLFVLVDDLAWSDLACYGHPWHHTPNIDRLAASGMRFTNGYAPAPICSASRASILTGKTTARLGFEFVTKDGPGHQQVDAPTPLRAPPLTLNLSLDEETIAERLNAQGYQTAYFGKWHLNAHHLRYLGWSPTHGPQQQGFRHAVEDFGMHPYAWTANTPPEIDSAGQLADDSMVHRVCDYLREPPSQPFFAMASSFYVHTPVKTRCTWLIEKYDARIPADVPNRNKRVAYAAFVETLDRHVGSMLDALEASGRRSQTLVVLTSDNGGHPEYAANGPLRGSKWNLYEGGIRVPLIASWPGTIAADATCDRPVIGYDLLPTFVDLAGGSSNGLDGTSIRRLLMGGQTIDDRRLIWHFPYYHPERGYAKAPETIGIDDFRVSRTHPHSAIRDGDYKLVHFAEDDQIELYDLQRDLSEQHDLSGELPQVANRLRNLLNRELDQMHARRAVSSEQ